MITIIADPHAYRAATPGARQAKSSRDYVPLRQELCRALNTRERLVVHVTDRLVLHWLEDFRAYPQDMVQWEPVDPGVDFRALFGVEPAPPFSPELLIALDIATLPQPPPAVEPLAWILGQRLDPIWSHGQPSAAHLAKLVSWAVHREDASKPSLLPLMQAQITRWADGHAHYGVLHAPSLRADSGRLIRRWALARYELPWQREQGLADAPILVVRPDPSAILASMREQSRAIGEYWVYRLASADLNEDSLRAATEQMSGWSDAELAALLTLLRRRPELVTMDLLGHLRHRFVGLPDAMQRIAQLDDRIQPPLPMVPDAAWTTERLLRWATGEYMPYFTWTVRTGQPREHQQACSLAFGDWLAQHYPTLLNSDTSPLLTRQFTWMRELLRANPRAILVWFVADGMTWWQGARLLAECQQRGLHPQRYESGVAMLPSITTVSKRALVTGVPSATQEQQTIAAAAHEQLRRSGIEAHVGYCIPQALEALEQPTPPRCVIVLSNTLDGLAHDMKEFSDNPTIRGYLGGVAEDFLRMREICQERGQPLHVLIGSDHGSTLLPAGAPARRLPQASREIVDVWEIEDDQAAAAPTSHRAAEITDPRRLTIEQPEHWYLLDKDRYQLGQSYLVPRGYGYVGRRPVGWTHGGLTPEEIIVPLLHLTPEPLQILALTVGLTGDLRPQQATTLTLEVVNPNAAPLDELVMQIGDLQPLSAGRIPSGSTIRRDVQFPARPIEGSELVLHWSLRGQILGLPYEQNGAVRLTVRRLQSKDSLNDMFT